ncbi:Sensor protein QseC [Marinomonas aquimarina]|uniref:histidine kinase n=1 Tax=Marinomonas aquimarina TaxID=295068 RepID=A0A1A8TFC1_9GAMM|nr:ATP-binding protein [Marinomonas aquimarina]SBS31208.1 Sensor protein QseC [Marinomonas aquimarina]
MLSILQKKLPNSIRQRTLIMVMSVFAFTSILLGVVGVIAANHEVEELFDARLAQQARLLLHLSNDDMEIGKNSPTFVYPKAVAELEEYHLSDVGHHYESKIYFRIWRNGDVVVASEDLNIEPQINEGNGFGYADSGAYEWRTFELKATSEEGNISTIIVAERSDVRGEMVTEIVLNSVLPEVIGWPLIAILVWMAVSLGLEPLKQLTSRIKLIEPSQLKPVSIENMPQELAPVQQAINTLLLSIDELMAREKRWIADAAHELRTPLAVLRLHAQNAESAETDAERQHALKQLQSGVDRSTRIVAQLLSYARIESQLQASEHAPIDVLKATRQIVADLYPVVWQRQITIEINEDQDGLMLPIEASHFEVILQNLISNALKFTPEGGAIYIDWHTQEGGLVFEFKDTGAGLEEAEIERLTERFYRGSDQSGAGLGLSIVATLTKYYGARLTFANNEPSGLIVRIFFPL